jgi:hypothetical protein
MVAVQLTTDEGAFICNIVESDVVKIAAKTPGTYVVIHCAIRLDAMFDGRYELYKTKTIETSSIDFYQSFQKKARDVTRKGQPIANARKASDD